MRQLGTDGPTVSAIGFGAMVLSPGIYSPVTDAEGEETLRKVLDLGVTLIDTANIYGDGHNERLVGRAIAGRRDEVVLATKFGGGYDAAGTLVPGQGRPDAVRRALDESLSRLGTGHVDLYYQHRVDPTTPIEETVGALVELMREGKVRHIGLSEASAATIRRAHAVHPLAAVETEYSLFTRDPEGNGVLAAVRELGIGFVPYSPLGRGMLTGAIKRPEDLADGDWRKTQPRFQGENLRRNLALVETVEAVAAEHGATAAQVALAWLLHQGEFVVPIPGTRRAGNMADNAKAANLKLTADDLARLDAAIPHGAAAGSRADERYVANVDR